MSSIEKTHGLGQALDAESAARVAEFNREHGPWQTIVAPPKRQHQPTHKATVEAILYCVRKRGRAALTEPSNRERLSRCDDAAIAEIKRRIEEGERNAA